MIYSKSVRNSVKIIIGVAAAILLAFFSYSTVLAQGSYETAIVMLPGGGDLSMEPGQRLEVMVEFQNTGVSTWQNDGPGYLSVYTYGPKYRRTVFDPGTWIWGDHLKRIRETEVAPGEKASVLFELHAPEEEGYYEETFKLAAEEIAWVSGGEFTLKISVEEKSENRNPKTEIQTETQTSDDGYAAELVVTSATRIKAQAGKSILFTVGFKNTGTKTWNNYAVQKPDVMIASISSDFSHPSWQGTKLAYVDSSVRPGEMAIVTFAFMAPKQNGLHLTKFQLAANGVSVPGAMIEIPVEVTGGSGEISTAPLLDNIDTTEYIDQPDIRVGVLIIDEETEDKVNITSHQSSFKLLQLGGILIAELPQDKVVTAFYKDGFYFYDVGQGLKKTTSPLRFEPNTPNAAMTIENFDRRVTRGSRYADNSFRGVLEIRYNDYKARTWVINELPIEYYLRGLAETSEAHHEEMNKAQMTAARTYAYYHMQRDGKRAKEFMHLASTASDQVYKGYDREIRSPKITGTAIFTAGQVVTYQNEVAITPYYARSNGRTKDWSQVWWGDQPHVKGVAVPCDAGRTQWGHGVGMPQSGAQCLAEDGKKYDEIIKYFFTGIELIKKWK